MLLANGIMKDKVHVFGIPIDTRFSATHDKSAIYKKMDLDSLKKTVLIMGGSGGLGPIKKVVFALDKINLDIQIVVVTGTNDKLVRYFKNRMHRFNKKIIITGYADNIDELMEISDIIITKPGGLTVSEALAKSIPILIVNPIPGQESKNTEFLLKEGAAIKAVNEAEAAILVENLFRAPVKLEAMKQSSTRIGNPDSAMNIAKMLLEL